MSADLLAEFDSFYQAPQTKSSQASPSSNDLAFLDSSSTLSEGWGNDQQTHWQGDRGSLSAGNAWGNMSSLSSPSNPVSNPSEQDIWGGFGEFSVPQGKSTSPSLQSLTSPSQGNFQRRGTVDLFNDLSSFGASVAPSRKPSFVPSVSRKDSNKGSVLFDADEEVDDDDFGDFETVASPLESVSQHLSPLFDTLSTTSEAPKASRPTHVSLASPSSITSPLPYPQAPISPSFKERNPFDNLGIATTTSAETSSSQKPVSAAPITAWPAYEAPEPKHAPFIDSPAPVNDLDDAWGDFADLPPETPEFDARRASGIEADAWGWDWNDQVPGTPPPNRQSPSKPSVPLKTQKATTAPRTTTSSKIQGPTPVSNNFSLAPAPKPAARKSSARPTTVPPPSVILTLLPQIINLAQTTLFQPIANQPFALKNRIMSEPETRKFLGGYLHIATVATRIIAGRKLRWKRDLLLSQSMKIGPAGAKGKSGMKLSGIDKAEIKKEDREVADVVRQWKDQLGKLKSAVAAANNSNHDILSHLVIPELAEVLHVTALKGAMTDVKPCALCGLKREERISKVDIEEMIEDSFGEWWIGYWGHRDCKNFWDEHESTLRQR